MRFFKLLPLLFFIIQVPSSVFGQSAQPYAVYMYSFTRYINWPSTENDGDFLLGVLGESSVTPYLKKMASQKKVNGRTIQLVTFNSPEEIDHPLDMLFVNAAWSESMEKAKNYTEALPHCLVITDRGSQDGSSHINFINEDDKLLFELNKSALERSGLKVSSELLALARIVEGKQSN